MKGRLKKSLIFAVAATACISVGLGVAAICHTDTINNINKPLELMGNYSLAAFAEEQTQTPEVVSTSADTSVLDVVAHTSTMYMISEGDQYILLATAFDFQDLLDNKVEGVQFGYQYGDKTYNGVETEGTTNVYYSSISFNKRVDGGTQTVINKATDIFGNLVVGYENAMLIVAEIPYLEGTNYSPIINATSYVPEFKGANFANDFAGTLAGQSNWKVGNVDYTWSNETFTFTKIETLNEVGDAYNDNMAGWKEIKGDWMAVNEMMGFGYHFQSAATTTFNFALTSAEGGNFAVRWALKDMNGNIKTNGGKASWGGIGKDVTVSDTVTAEEGDVLYILVNKEGDSTTDQCNFTLTLSPEQAN